MFAIPGAPPRHGTRALPGSAARMRVSCGSLTAPRGPGVRRGGFVGWPLDLPSPARGSVTFDLEDVARLLGGRTGEPASRRCGEDGRTPGRVMVAASGTSGS